MSYSLYDRCPRTGFAITKWVDVHGQPLNVPPTVEDVKAKRAYPFYDTPERCTFTLDDLGPDNRPFVYVNEQTELQGLHGYSGKGLVDYLRHGNRKDAESRANWGSPYTGMILPVYSGPPEEESLATQDMPSPPELPPLESLMEKLDGHAVDRLQRELLFGEPRLLTAGLSLDTLRSVKFHLNGGVPFSNLTAELMGDIPPTTLTSGIYGAQVRRIREYLTGAVPLPFPIQAAQPNQQVIWQFNTAFRRRLSFELIYGAPRRVTARLPDAIFERIVAAIQRQPVLLARLEAEIGGRQPRLLTADIDQATFADLQTQAANPINPPHRMIDNEVLNEFAEEVSREHNVTFAPFTGPLISLRNIRVIGLLASGLRDGIYSLTGWNGIECKTLVSLFLNFQIPIGFSLLGYAPPHLSAQDSLRTMSTVLRLFCMDMGLGYNLNIANFEFHVNLGQAQLSFHLLYNEGQVGLMSRPPQADAQL